jgi:hypothetical protein
MAGAIILSEDRMWTAAGWLFDWAVRFLIREVDDPQVAAALDEVIRENIGIVALDSLPAGARATILRKLGDELVPAAAATLAADLPDRQGAVDYLAELAGFARELSGG